MAVSPMDIKHQTFKKSMRGFDCDEVAHFLEMLSGELEQLLKEKNILAEQVDRLTFEVTKYEKLEKTIQETLIRSQKTLEDSRGSAEREASIILKEAEIKADEYLRKIESDKDMLKKDVGLLREQRSLFIARFRALIKSQLEMLNLIETEPAPEDKTEKELKPVTTEMIEKPEPPPQAKPAEEEGDKNFSAKIE